jgi:NAD(P)-dependent dehydrogenase (short-subunit alcohol dehydrogenase family)
MGSRLGLTSGLSAGLLARRSNSWIPPIRIPSPPSLVGSCPPAGPCRSSSTDEPSWPFPSHGLWPTLVAAKGARVVSVSSRGHQIAGIDFEDIDFRARPYDKWLAYDQSKTANALFAVALDRRGRVVASGPYRCIQVRSWQVPALRRLGRTQRLAMPIGSASTWQLRYELPRFRDSYTHQGGKDRHRH